MRCRLGWHSLAETIDGLVVGEGLDILVLQLLVNGLALDDASPNGTEHVLVVLAPAVVLAVDLDGKVSDDSLKARGQVAGVEWVVAQGISHPHPPPARRAPGPRQLRTGLLRSAP